MTSGGRGAAQLDIFLPLHDMEFGFGVEIASLPAPGA
jgi:hypothetical protein